MKKHPLQTFPRGFTLVELLVVIAIIGVLASILLPALAKVKDKARAAQARTEMKNIVGAIHNYKADYSRMPVTSGGAAYGSAGRDFTFGTQGLTTSIATLGYTVINGMPPATPYEANNSELVAIVGDYTAFRSGANTVNVNHGLNPKQHGYLDGKPVDVDETTALAGGIGMDLVYRDPWGMPYFVTIDTSYDETCVDAIYGLQAVSQNSGTAGWNGTFNGVDVAGAGNHFGVRAEAMVWSCGKDKTFDPAAKANPALQNANTDNILSWTSK